MTSAWRCGVRHCRPSHPRLDLARPDAGGTGLLRPSQPDLLSRRRRRLGRRWLSALLHVFDRHGVPLDLAVIPAALSESLAATSEPGRGRVRTATPARLRPPQPRAGRTQGRVRALAGGIPSSPTSPAADRYCRRPSMRRWIRCSPRHGTAAPAGPRTPWSHLVSRFSPATTPQRASIGPTWWPAMSRLGPRPS